MTDSWRSQPLWFHRWLPPSTSHPDPRRDLAVARLRAYLPLVERLGAARLKAWFEDVAFRILDPTAYQWVYEVLEEHAVEREAALQCAVSTLAVELPKLGIEPYLAFRMKSAYSTYQKALRKGTNLDEILDLGGVRVIVDREAECYQALSLVHSLWAPIPGQSDDYIAHPKPNGYRSLHTVVMAPAGLPFEVQIRTWEMHGDAVWGCAAHWRYSQQRDAL